MNAQAQALQADMEESNGDGSLLPEAMVPGSPLIGAPEAEPPEILTTSINPQGSHGWPQFFAAIPNPLNPEKFLLVEVDIVSHEKRKPQYWARSVTLGGHMGLSEIFSDQQSPLPGIVDTLILTDFFSYVERPQAETYLKRQQAKMDVKYQGSARLIDPGDSLKGLDLQTVPIASLQHGF